MTKLIKDGRKRPFIVIEGGDGTGTTTQVAELCQRTNEQGVDHVGFVAGRLPSEGEIGQLLRRMLKGDHPTWSWRVQKHLFCADRCLYEEQVMDPALGIGPKAWAEPQGVVLDRYGYSTAVYQGIQAAEKTRESGGVFGFASSHSSGWEAGHWAAHLIRRMQMEPGWREPDLAILLDVSPEEAARRRVKRHGVTELFDFYEFQIVVAREYLGLWRHLAVRHDERRYVVVDGNRPVDEIAKDITALAWPLFEV
jgi:thymidylate kinase